MTTDKSATTYIAGHRGLAGSAIWRRLERDGYTDLVGRTSSEVDLRDRDAVFELFREVKPKNVVLAAARVGGILANDSFPDDFLSDNLRIQLNVMDAAREDGVDRLLFLGSSCIYPRLAPQPIKEEYLLTGHLEPTNEAYAIAKIAGIIQVQSVRKQYGLRWISAMPTNLYGPGDNFSKENSHVVPALIRRFVDAQEAGASRVVNWGSGTPMREFLHVDDLGSAVSCLLDRYDSPETINVGTGTEQSIKEIAELIGRTVGYRGAIEWDTSKKDGTPRKLLDISRIRGIDWEPSIALAEGLRQTVDWYLKNRSVARS